MQSAIIAAFLAVTNWIELVKNFAPLAAASLLLASVSTAVSADVNYQLNITEPAHHLAEVTATFPKSSGLAVDFKLPAWRTGRYEILNLANGVTHFEAKDSKGRSLTWEKVEKSTWRVHLDKPDTISISYQVYANQLTKRTRHIDETHAYIDASGFFMFAEATRNQPLTVELKTPKSWKAYSGLNKKKKNTFTASNYDELIDAPIETGISTVETFSANDKDYELVIWGKGNFDSKKIKKDLNSLVDTYSAIWSDIPYERYVFMVHAGPNLRGATEHANSTIIQKDSYGFAPRDKYLGFLSTASHEFIHTWNVKAYRPQGLVPYDYTNPNYSTLLWISEGSTSYFQNQLLLRAGIMKPKEFFENIAKRIFAHQHKPGAAVQSVAESSFDTWIGMHGDYGTNFNVNIYSEGYMVSWMLDAKILADTNLAKSYRDVHQALYSNFRVPKSFNENDVVNILKDVAQQDYQGWWNENVLKPTTPNFNALLDSAGLKLVRADDEKPKPTIGAKLSSSDNVITRVRKDSSAWKAGLAVDDEVVAINGMRLRADSFDARLKEFKAGDKITLQIFRRETLQEITVTLEEDFSKPAKIKLVESPTEAQKAFYKAWLGVDYPESL